MNPPGVLFLLDSAPTSWGTREEFQARLFPVLAKRGFVPVLVNPERLPAAVAKRFAQLDVQTVTLNHHRGDYARHLRALRKTFNIEIAHIRFFDYFSTVPWLCRLAGIRHILFTEANSGELAAKGVKLALLRLRTRAACYPLEKVIAISHFIRRRLLAGGLDSARITVVYNGVDNHRFHSDASARARVATELGLDPEVPIVVTIAALLPQKSIDTLIEACAIIRERGQAVQLLIAGIGPKRDEWQALSRTLNVENCVHWLGYRADPLLLLQGCDVFALPSVGEAFGNVTAEAMACATPVVGSRSGATVELVEDGVTGLLANARDPRAFADAIQQLASDANLRHEMGRRGAQRVRQLFTVDKAIGGTVAIYDELRGSARAG